MLIHSCTRLIQNGGVWDWQKLNSKCFLKKIATYFQGDLSPEEFTRTLFKKIYLNPNGDTLAKKINKDLDSQYFKEFIDTETDDTIKGLCAAFADECPGIDNENFKNKIAERFKKLFVMQQQ